MTTFQILLGMSAVLQVCLLAMISNTLIDIKRRLASVPQASVSPEPLPPGSGVDASA
jgi:hypothetical protein